MTGVEFQKKIRSANQKLNVIRDKLFNLSVKIDLRLFAQNDERFSQDEIEEINLFDLLDPILK